ncbi:GNAT family N-acetyltransferase [Streptomyces profundus]|uniref:GNAT family N-acetyltransferase n=1 Tax=Streptomyces profundus TaxID=2867410 RepID=UPI001D1668DA|nr:GNAT family N-acetyltransferase [Streptomyces sp. MA3_2.13]UED87150.1 GNAT family N-acetyltransferase [Streptomyces sp. MA3_2.13]
MVDERRYRRRLFVEPDDLRETQTLAQRLWDRPGRWHPGELAFFRRQYATPPPGHRTALWADADGTTVAWAWKKPPAALDLQLDPDRLDVLTPLLGWFDEVAEGRARSVTVLDAETELIEALHAHGYRRRDEGLPFFVHLRRDLAELPALPPLPPGYRAGPASAADDPEARARAHRAAFPAATGFTGADHRRITASWPYRPETDWRVTAADGSTAAFALAWYDEGTRTAALEPVGTVPGHRRLGLARIAMLGALHAARRLGARTARVCARGDAAAPAAAAAYAALGFRPFARNIRLDNLSRPTGG